MTSSGVNVDNMRLFIAELRSGNWTQGTLRLARADGSYCCLGVACELAARAIDPEAKKVTEDGIFFWEEKLHLPEEAMQWLGIESPNPRLRWEGDSARYPATTLNDAAKLSFAQIADCFEQTFLPRDWRARRDAQNS